MKIVVVGGAGYIGGHLCDLLEEQYNYDVTVYDNLLYEERYLKRGNLIHGDVRDMGKLYRAVEHSDAVVWLAAVVGDKACEVHPNLTRQVNVESLKSFCSFYSGKIVFASTCSVYGANNDILTEKSPTNPLSLYAETKLQAEKFLGEKDLIFRLGTLHGLGDDYSRIRFDLVVNAMTLRAHRKDPIVLHGGGKQWRPLLHVKDVASAMAFGLDSDLKGTYNLRHTNLQIRDIATMVRTIVPGTKLVEQPETADPRNYQVSDEKIRNTGWKPNYSLEDGVFEVLRVLEEGRIRSPFSSVYTNAEYFNEHFSP